MAYVFAAVVEYAIVNFNKKPEIDRLSRRAFPLSFMLVRYLLLLLNILWWQMSNGKILGMLNIKVIEMSDVKCLNVNFTF